MTKKETTLALNVETSNDLYKALNESRYIIKKQLNNDIVSYNFSRDAFYKGVWNSLIVKARGLFINSKTQSVVARSYDKFFNIGEQLFTEIRNLKSNLVFPVTAYKKENGFLGIVSWDRDNNELFVASKSTNEGDFAEMVRKHFDELDKKDDIIEYLKQNNVTFVFEVVDIEKDPHIIKYDESCIYLLDIISNKLEKCEKMSYDQMCEIANKFDLNHKQKEFVFNDWSEFLKFYTEVEKDNSIQIEGWVFEDQNEFMVKFKTPYYKFWKYIRSIKEALCKERKIPQVFKSAEEVNVINFMKRMSIDELNKKSIIDIREEFNRESK